MTEHYIPQERDLPAGRLTKLKEDLMAQIQHDLEKEGAAPVVTHHRWRRIGLTAAGIAAGFAFAISLVLGGPNSASANTAERTDDGAIIITIREGKNPQALQQRLTDLGVPAVVDFLERGFGCDPARSTGWVVEPRGEELFTWTGETPDGDAQLGHLSTPRDGLDHSCRSIRPPPPSFDGYPQPACIARTHVLG